MTRAFSVSVLCVAASVALGAQNWKKTAPESFRINGQVLGSPGGVAASMTLQIDKYTTDDEHAVLVDALKGGDQAGFLTVLRKAPIAGALKIGQKSVPIRWAREQAQGDDRRIAVMTEEPVFFVGGGAVDAKPTEGYDVAVLEFTIDTVGLGKGTMAPAAKVKAGGPAGIEIADYSGKRIELMTVARNKS